MFQLNEKIFKYAIVDIGANSVRMNIYDIDTETGEFSTVLSVRSLLGLAAYAKDGALTGDGFGKLFAVLREFLARANSIPCDLFSAFATASLRGLSNSDRVVKSIRSGLGIDIEIISGEAEAAFDHAAIRYRFPETPRGLLIDMGGGSTEFVCFDKDSIRETASLPIGCVMLTKRFTACTKKDPFPTDGEMGAIRSYVREQLSAYPAFRGSSDTAFLIGGTARAAAKLNHTLTGDGGLYDGYTFTAEGLDAVCQRAFSDMREGGRWLRECVPDRVLSIIAGLVAYQTIAETLGTKKFVISNAGVREGYLIEYIRRNFLRKTQES
ncbi:MAG: hypothetical protein IJV98_08015 [Clostridia bacterium]|nr:hypothetical protein [Clostridia bacterium]